MSKQNQKGFTIIELLIAMTVFTFVLLVVSGAVVQIGRLYHKALTASRTQEVARSVTDDLSRAIQYTPGVVRELSAPAGNTNSLCVGSRRYDFIQNRRVDKNQTTGRSLVSRNDPANCTSTTNLATATTGTEMLGNDMRVTRLTVQDSADDPSLATGAYRLIVKVVYGDNDLLCRPAPAPGVGGTSDCTNNIALNFTDPANQSATDLQCKNVRSGTEFCSASELSTIVERRLE